MSVLSISKSWMDSRQLFRNKLFRWIAFAIFRLVRSAKSLFMIYNIRKINELAITGEVKLTELITISSNDGFRKVSRRKLLSSKPLSALICSFNDAALIPVAGNQLVESQTVFGNDIPDWIFESHPYFSIPIYTIRFDSCYVYPTWGAVLPSASSIYKPSVMAARYKSPDLTQIPGMVIHGGKLSLDIAQLPRHTLEGSYILLNHWGGKNYGHFLFDSLPGVLLFYEEILRGTLQILTGRLQRWQKELLRLLGVPAEKIKIVDQDSCRCASLLWPSFLYGNLNQPALFTRTVGDYLRELANPEDRYQSAELIYISRKGLPMRRMENEADLTAILKKNGFSILAPENYTVEQQIKMFSRAKIIVGEMGAGLANILFAPPMCKIIEIMPEITPSKWIKRLCGLLCMEWYCIWARVPSEGRVISVVDGIKYDNLTFSYRVNVDHVLRSIENAKAC
jgi:capsular polysaccharide biosynthesis protein